MPASARFSLVPKRPYSLTHTAARFARFADAVNQTGDGCYRRMLVVDGEPLLVSVAQRGPASRAVLEIGLRGKGARRANARRAAQALAERALGASQDVAPFYRAFRDDPLLGPAIRAFRGLRVAGSPHLFETLVTAVLSQQINLSFAYSIRDELTRSFGRRARFAGARYFAFPTPQRIQRETPRSLRRFRLSRSKAETLHRLALSFSCGDLDDAELRRLSDEQVIDRLIAMKGIGRWTAETALMRGLGRSDAFPGGDLGVVKYLARDLLGRDGVASEAEMRDFAERWRPYRALALVYAYAELGRRRAEA